MAKGSITIKGLSPDKKQQQIKAAVAVGMPRNSSGTKSRKLKIGFADKGELGGKPVKTMHLVEDPFTASLNGRPNPYKMSLEKAEEYARKAGIVDAKGRLHPSFK